MPTSLRTAEEEMMKARTWCALAILVSVALAGIVLGGAPGGVEAQLECPKNKPCFMRIPASQALLQIFIRNVFKPCWNCQEEAWEEYLDGVFGHVSEVTGVFIPGCDFLALRSQCEDCLAFHYDNYKTKLAKCAVPNPANNIAACWFAPEPLDPVAFSCPQRQ